MQKPSFGGKNRYSSSGFAHLLSFAFFYSDFAHKFVRYWFWVDRKLIRKCLILTQMKEPYVFCDDELELGDDESQPSYSLGNHAICSGCLSELKEHLEKV